VKAVQLNPREVKRFINNIILAQSVFGKPINELIVVQALNFRHEWNKFLELITPDEIRQIFFNEYKKLKEGGQAITTKEQLNKVYNEEKIKTNASVFKDIIKVYKELLQENNYALRDFLNAGATEILLHIEKMEEHRRALDTTKHKTVKEEKVVSSDPLLKLLQAGYVEIFNEIRDSAAYLKLDFQGANLSGINLSHADFTRTNLFRANLSNANVSAAILSHANLSSANLSSAGLFRANLSCANLTRTNLFRANLSRANLSAANLSSTYISGADLSLSVIIGVKHYEGLICGNSNFDGAIIDDQTLANYLSENAINVPTAVEDKKELGTRLRKAGYNEGYIEKLLYNINELK
jgi:uncharacterized protein YjbI with pentapeptide repeats